MNRINKKAIGGIVLASILVLGMFTFIPGASADLTALDKFGTIINMLTKILTEVTETNEDLLLKKRFYQFVNDTDASLPEGGGTGLIAEVRVVSCAPELVLANACAFNVESILIKTKEDGETIVIGPAVDGISSRYIALKDGSVNFLVDASFKPDLFEGDSNEIGPIGVIGASESVRVFILSEDTIDKIEFNGEQPQGMELELVVTQESFG